MHAAALLLFAIQCLNEDYSRVDARIERKTGYALVRIARPDLRGTRYRSAGEVVVYYGDALNDGTRDRVLRLYVDRGGEWWQLLEHGGAPSFEDRMGPPPPPVVVERVAGLVAVTYTQRSHHGRIAKTVLLDFRPSQPRLKLLVACSDAAGRGACMGPTTAREPHKQLTCDASLRCTSTERQWIDWTTRTATRTFDLLTDETIRPKRLGAVTYPSGEDYARAFLLDRAVLTQRVVIERIGPVTPVFELSPGSILFAGPDKNARVGARFFHLTPGRWRQIPLTSLTGADDKADAPSPLDRDHTPDMPPLTFFAWNIEHAGRGRLVEVLVREGEARSLYWIMFDPNGRTDAIRLAADTPEFRHCDDQLFPVSVIRLEIPDAGLPAYLTAIPAWRMTDLEAKTLPKHCGLIGRLGWSSTKGWQPTLFEAPCANPWLQSYSSVLDDDGTLGFELVKPR